MKQKLTPDTTNSFFIFQYKILNHYIIVGENEYIKHPPNKYYKDGNNLLKRLNVYKDSTLYFLDNHEVDYNNNLSERLL